jgi:uncharacterized oxidoreductase
MSTLLHRPTTVLLTGGTSGIGAELCRMLLDGGHHVIVLARSASRLPAAPGLDGRDADLADPAALQACARAVVADYPDLGLLINNAGVQHAVALADPASHPGLLAEEALVNLVAPAILAQAVLPGFLARGAGGIVNVSSGLASFPKERTGLYCASKAGLSSLTRSLRYQVGARGLAVVEVVLPMVDTPMTAGRPGRKVSAEAAAAAILAGLRQGRPVIRVGAARAVPVIAALAPWFGHRMLRGT